LEKLRQTATDLGFAEVGEVRRFVGKEADGDRRERDDSDRWLLIQAGAFVNLGDGCSVHVAPSVFYALDTWPGEGCESANFGLARYPASVVVDGTAYPTHLPTTAWRWRSFCKTQYANDPECGGVQNFLRCHMRVVGLLDAAKVAGLGVHVSDEGNYWEKRDIEALAKEVGEWDAMVAAICGKIKDAGWGDKIQAPILGRQDFEHLEAQGAVTLAAHA
jgi:hypothetical protein